MNPKISLIVLRCFDLKRSLLFYETLGIKFTEEKHGGPTHYSADLGGIILELYPMEEKYSNVRLAFEVDNLKEVLNKLDEYGWRVIKKRQDGTIIVHDADRNKVELTQREYDGC